MSPKRGNHGQKKRHRRDMKNQGWTAVCATPQCGSRYSPGVRAQRRPDSVPKGGSHGLYKMEQRGARTPRERGLLMWKQHNGGRG
eukprot:12587315-Heterocapsa_arctica.AAC.1